MTQRVYNTLTRKKEPFETIEPGKVRMYVCGPTVYDKAHVGHAMSSLVFDVIRRYLEYRGYQVRHVMNYTDVEDKIIQRAKAIGVEPMPLAESLIAEYDRQLRALNVLPATLTPRASDEIDAILQMVGSLIEKGHAYVLDGDVYFRVARDKDYGRLSGRRLEDTRAGFRFEADARKEDPADFALWKSAKPGEPAWDSPWGKGRPGWHIECSAMILNHLGEQIDIHGGGNDLVFPHHENEIAQTESLTGKPFVRYWIHNGMLQLSGEKMSKSLGNLVTVEEFLTGHRGDVLRMLVLNSSYRSPLTYTDEVVEQAGRALERLKGALRPASPAAEPPAEAEKALEGGGAAAKAGFLQAMDDDFNTPGALASLFELVRAINQARDAGASAQALGGAQAVLSELAGVLGLRLEEGDGRQQEAGRFIDLLVELREELRVAKQWALADRVRERLQELGVTLEDGKAGTTWKAR
ncbi:MAG TPA: cysteine--tRNA ligase [Anaerolineales bacterium]|nr:cysteine--tRNA ligase [Anaerolineales bacterium]